MHGQCGDVWALFEGAMFILEFVKAALIIHVFLFYLNVREALAEKSNVGGAEVDDPDAAVVGTEEANNLATESGGDVEDCRLALVLEHKRFLAWTCLDCRA